MASTEDPHEPGAVIDLVGPDGEITGTLTLTEKEAAALQAAVKNGIPPVEALMKMMTFEPGEVIDLAGPDGKPMGTLTLTEREAAALQAAVKRGIPWDVALIRALTLGLNRLAD